MLKEEFMIFNIIILVIWIIFGILLSSFFLKMINILVENKRGSWWYFYWKLQFSFRPFKKFINESNLNSKQKEEYLSLYKRGVYAKRGVFLFMFLIAITFTLIVLLYTPRSA